MPIRERHPTVVRMVEGRKASPDGTDCTVRVGLMTLWIRSLNGMLTAMAGPNAMCSRRGVDLHHQRQAMTRGGQRC